MSRDFGSKNGQLPIASRMQSFEAKRKQKTPKDAKWNDLQNGYLGFSNVLVFDPQKSKFRFFKNKYLQNQFFEDIPKTGIYSIELYTNYQCTKFQANIFISGCAMAQKPGKGDDVTFLNRIFGISNCRTSKQMTFLES